MHLSMCVDMYSGPKKRGQLRHTSKHVNDNVLVGLIVISTHKNSKQYTFWPSAHCAIQGYCC